MKSLMHITKQMKRTFHVKWRNVSWKLKHQQSPGATPTLQFFPILRGSSTESSKFQTVWGMTRWMTRTSKRLSRWMTSATFLLWTINLGTEWRWIWDDHNGKREDRRVGGYYNCSGETLRPWWERWSRGGVRETLLGCKLGQLRDGLDVEWQTVLSFFKKSLSKMNYRGLRTWLGEGQVRRGCSKDGDWGKHPAFGNDLGGLDDRNVCMRGVGAGREWNGRKERLFGLAFRTQADITRHIKKKLFKNKFKKKEKENTHTHK